MRLARSIWFSILFAVLAPCPLWAQIQLAEGAPWSGTVERGQWVRFVVDVKPQDSELHLALELLQRDGDCDIYVRFDAAPTLDAHDYRSTSSARSEVLRVANWTQPKLRTGRYHVGLYGKTRVPAKLKATMPAIASTRSGMGALPYLPSTPDRGTTFRVWAPFASRVCVAGEFNGWRDDEIELVQEKNGCWSFDLRGAVPGMQYKYVISNGKQKLWRVDPCEEQITNSVGNSVIFDNRFQWTDRGILPPAWNEMIIYQMHVGTFNDTVGGRPGTFDSAIAKLDYLADLGVNTIELLPVHEFPGDYSWGYNPSYPFTIEEAYGGPMQLKRFVNEAHTRSIAVIMDVVHNHWGPMDMDLWRFDGWHQGNFGGVYFYQDARSSTPWGDTRPDFGRKEVRQYIRDNVMMWLEDFHIDGLRWDSVVNIRRYSGGDIPEGWSLVQQINDEIDMRFPWKISIAEDLQGDAWITNDTAFGGAGFDAQWAPQFVHPLRNAIVPSRDQDRNMFDVKNAIDQRYSGDAFARVVYTESHDEVANGRSRVPEEIWPGNAGSWYSRKRSTQGASIVFTAPGIPMIFQGQELLEDEYFRDTDPLDWSKRDTFRGIHAMYRDLMRLRRNWFNHTRGLRGQSVHVFHVNNSDKVVAFHRWDQGGPGDDVIVVSNFRTENRFDYRIGLPRSGTWRVRFNSDWNGYSEDFANTWVADVTSQSIAWDGMPFSGTLTLPAYSTVILSQ